MKQRWLTYLLCLCLTLPVAAQERVKIGGTVKDESGNPIELAVVRIDGTAIGTVCDLKGRYSLKFESRDSVTVVFSMLGYRTRKKVLLNPHGNIPLNMTLLSIDYELGEVSVTERRRQTSTMQQLDANRQAFSPDASGGSVESLLTTQAGVSSNNELSSQYNVRGGSFDENMVYVNGVEIYRPLLTRQGEQEGLSFVNPSMIERLGFSTGGYEARFGDKMSSVLDITYKKPRQWEGSATVSLLGASAYVGAGGRKWSWTNAARYRTNRYLLGTLDTKGEYRPRFLDYQTYFNRTIGKRWEVEAIGYVSENRYEFEPEDRYTRFGTLNDVREFKVYFDGQEKDLFRTYLGAARVSFNLNEHSRLTAQFSAFHTQEQEAFDIQGSYWLNSSTDNETASTPQSVGKYMEHARNRLKADVRAFSLSGKHDIKQHSLQWGVEMKHEHVEDRMREWELLDSAGYSLPSLSGGPYLSYVLNSENEIESRRYSFYAQNTYKRQTAAGLFTLTAGIRGSYWEWSDEFILSPRLSLALIPTFNERFTLRVATGIYYQAPFYKEMRDTVSANGTTRVVLNQDIRSQRAIHIVAGGDYNFRVWNRPFRFTAEAYYKALSNLIPYNISNMRINYYGQNMAKGYAAGVDMRLFGEFVPGTDSWLTFSLMKTEEKLNGRRLPRPTDQRYRISLYFTDHFPGSRRWRMNLRGVLAGGLPFGPPHKGLESAIFRTPPYRRVDIGMAYSLIDNTQKETGAAIRDLWVGVDVLNLLNIGNVNSYYWVTDSNNGQFAVPNYLTSRQINVKVLLNF